MRSPGGRRGICGALGRSSTSPRRHFSSSLRFASEYPDSIVLPSTVNSVRLHGSLRLKGNRKCGQPTKSQVVTPLKYSFRVELETRQPSQKRFESNLAL